MAAVTVSFGHGAINLVADVLPENAGPEYASDRAGTIDYSPLSTGQGSRRSFSARTVISEAVAFVGVVDIDDFEDADLVFVF
jgi:hypothetical protein